MELRFRRLLFYSVWFFLLLLPFYIVFNNLDIQNLLSNSLVLINTFQRLSGSLAFVLLFSQIVIGSNMDWWVQAIGAKAYKIHITQGLCIYALVLIHPVLYLVFNYQTNNDLVQTLLAILPTFATNSETLITFGKIALITLTITVSAAYFRTNTFFRRNWRYFHLLNYLVFYLVFLHARVGTDFDSPVFYSLYLAAFFFISATLIYKLVKLLRLKDLVKSKI